MIDKMQISGVVDLAAREEEQTKQAVQGMRFVDERASLIVREPNLE